VASMMWERRSWHWLRSACRRPPMSCTQKSMDRQGVVGERTSLPPRVGGRAWRPFHVAGRARRRSSVSGRTR
jgi:hypothetical protein